MAIGPSPVCHLCLQGLCAKNFFCGSHFVSKRLSGSLTSLWGTDSRPQVVLVGKNLPAMQETQEMGVRSLGQEDPLEKGMATHSSISCLENPMDKGA